MSPDATQLDLKAAAALALPQRVRPEQAAAFVALGIKLQKKTPANSLALGGSAGCSAALSD